jgi:hypothetical protein
MLQKTLTTAEKLSEQWAEAHINGLPGKVQNPCVTKATGENQETRVYCCGPIYPEIANTIHAEWHCDRVVNTFMKDQA